MKESEMVLRRPLTGYTIVARTLGILAIVVLLYLLFQGHGEYQELKDLNKVSVAELKVSRDQKGVLTARLDAFETQRTKDFLQLKTRDSLTIELQKEVKIMGKYLKQMGSVTKFSTEGEVETVVLTEVTKDEQGDPIYKSKFNLDGWVWGNTIATKDTTYHHIQYKDNYTLVIGREPTGFLGLGRGKAFGQITSLSPYNTVKTMKVYQVSAPTRKNFSIAPSINIGVDFTGKIYTTIGTSVQFERLSIKL